MENKEKFKELLRNEDFVAKLLEMQTPEEVQSEFKSQGVDISVEEVAELGGIINYLIKEEKTQLSEEDLVKISGGKLNGIQSWLIGVPNDPENTEYAIANKARIEGASKKLGELEMTALTILIAVPVVTGVTKLVEWGIKRLTNEFDNRIDKKKTK